MNKFPDTYSADKVFLSYLGNKEGYCTDQRYKITAPFLTADMCTMYT